MKNVWCPLASPVGSMVFAQVQTKSVGHQGVHHSPKNGDTVTSPFTSTRPQGMGIAGGRDLTEHGASSSAVDVGQMPDLNVPLPNNATSGTSAPGMELTLPPKAHAAARVRDYPHRARQAGDVEQINTVKQQPAARSETSPRDRGCWSATPPAVRGDDRSADREAEAQSVGLDEERLEQPVDLVGRHGPASLTRRTPPVRRPPW
jgi:hypothetical protein